jgi:hypothetical protein
VRQNLRQKQEELEALMEDMAWGVMAEEELRLDVHPSRIITALR